jgi:glycosyltransferase involved in cell wall biosynthesis
VPAAEPGTTIRILQVHNRYRQLGGEDGVVAAEADLLRSRGHVVEQLIVENPDSDRAAIGPLLRSSWNRSSAELVSSAIDRTEPDVVHFHNTWFVLTAAAIAAAADRRPTFVTVHNYRLACVNAQFLRDGSVCTDCLGRPSIPGIIHGCYRGSRVASAAAAASQITIRRNGVLRREDVTVLVHTPFAAEVAGASGAHPDRIRIHENFVTDPGRRTLPAADSDEVLFVGRLSPEKGVDLVMDGWRGAAAAGLTLTVVGDGPEFDRLAARAASLAAVDFPGRLPGPEVSARMRRARCLVVPSRWYESQPLVILEALAAGLPVIATDWPPIRSILAEMPVGALIDVSGWASVAERLVDDGWIARASDAARAIYQDRFTPDVAYDRLVDLYRGKPG